MDKLWKARFENHPVVFGFTLLAIGFGAGVGAPSVLAALNKTEVIPNQASGKSPECQITGLSDFERSHQNRLATLHKWLIDTEKKSISETLISPYRNLAKESATRIRRDISAENETFRSVISTLKTKCE